MKRSLVFAAAGAIFVLHPGFAAAADAGTPDGSSRPGSDSQDSVDVPAKDASIFVPVGWVQVPAQAGAVVVFRAAGDADAQIDVRTSTPVDPPRQPNYFLTFNTRIKSAGFEQTSRDNVGACGEHDGTELTYRGRIDGRAFQLVVCQWAVSSRVWLVSAFYPEAARQFYYPGFERLLVESHFE